jgi:hypothetical protein
VKENVIGISDRPAGLASRFVLASSSVFHVLLVPRFGPFAQLIIS